MLDGYEKAALMAGFGVGMRGCVENGSAPRPQCEPSVSAVSQAAGQSEDEKTLFRAAATRWQRRLLFSERRANEGEEVVESGDGWLA